jgi:hypothetical protein
MVPEHNTAIVPATLNNTSGRNGSIQLKRPRSRFFARPQKDGRMGKFIGWVTATHTLRYHAHNRSGGTGHLYQGPFKSFPCQDDEHFLTVCRYVERNALSGGLAAIPGD